MSEVLEILKYILPALVVFITVYYTMRSFMQMEERKRKTEILLNNQKIIVPVRLQAYERVTLFLERISPGSMLKRLQRKELTVAELQNKMLQTIRNEFEHNFSQQLYLSSDAWQQVVAAKERIIQFINTTASKLQAEQPSIHLAKLLLEGLIEMDKSPTTKAVEFLKKEIQQII